MLKYKVNYLMRNVLITYKLRIGFYMIEHDKIEKDAAKIAASNIIP